MPKRASTTRARSVRGKAAARAKGKRKAPAGRTEAVVREMLDRLANGERWAEMAGRGKMPHANTPYRWVKEDPEFAADWALAKRIGADMRADQVLGVAETATKETLPVDRFHVGALKWHVDRDTRLYGPRKDEPDLGAGRTIIIRVRQFEAYVDEEGVERVREIEPLAPVTSGPEA